MSDYDLSLTGAQIDAALNKVHNADSIPTNGSQNMITSDAVHDSLSGYVLSSNVVTNLNSPDNTTIPTTEATKSYVDNKGLTTGYTELGTTSASGTASSSGFIIAKAKGSSGADSRTSVTVAGIEFENDCTYYANGGNSSTCVPIAAGETYSATASGASGQKIYFKALS